MMALQKGRPGARKIGGHFLMRQVFLFQNKVISFLVDVENFDNNGKGT